MKTRYFTIPNVLTLGNLLCGCLALYYAFVLRDLQMVFWLTALAALFDFFDGFAARLLKSYSALGKELDSLADMVSFGVVPSASLLTLYVVAEGVQPYGYLAFIVALFSALRLARFNIDEEQGEEFIGLPTPANALLITSFGYAFSDGVLPFGAGWLLAAGGLLACLLISPIRMFSLKFKTFSLRANALRYAFLALSLTGIILFGIAALPGLMILYIIISAIRHLVLLRG